MDRFPQRAGTSRTAPGVPHDGSTVMGYVDGNTVTHVELGERFAERNSWATSMDLPTPGALNLIDGQTAVLW